MQAEREFCFDSYDAIGFDLDHTVLKYKLKPLFSLIYDMMAQFLVTKHNYTRNLLETVPCEWDFVQKGIILDKKRGNFLKLDSNYKIIKAYHGTKLMSEEALSDVYGIDHVWEESKGIPFRTCTDKISNLPFYIFKDYFVVPGALVCAKIVDGLDKENNGPLPVYSFFDDFINSVLEMYDVTNFKLNAGFFKALKENTELYAEPCSTEFKQWLHDLKRSRKIFLCTNAYFDCVEFMCKFCIGEDWTDYFDIIITNSHKSSFFYNSTPFYRVHCDGVLSQISPEEIEPHIIYSHGNWNDLKKAVSVASGKENPNFLYIGDSLVDDVYAPSNFVQGDTIAIVEEISTEGISHNLTKGNELLLSETWGSFFGTPSTNGTKLSIWSSILSQHATLAVPSTKMLPQLHIMQKVPSFALNSPSGGYFPFKPSLFNVQ